MPSSLGAPYMRNYIAIFVADLLIFDDTHTQVFELVVMKDSVPELASDIQNRIDELPVGWTIEFGPPGLGPIIPAWIRLDETIILNIFAASAASRSWLAFTQTEAFQDPDTGLLMGESPRKTWSNGH